MMQRLTLALATHVAAAAAMGAAGSLPETRGPLTKALPLKALTPLVLDVRTEEEWNEGHISCAHRLPVQDDPTLIDQVKALVNGDLTAPIVTYCHSGVRAGRAKANLTDAGFTYVRNGGGYAIPPGNTEKLEHVCTCCSMPVAPIMPGPPVNPKEIDLPFVVLGTGSGQKGDVENATATWLAQAGGTGIDTAYGYQDEGGIKAALADVKADVKPFSQMAHIFLETKIPCSDYDTASVALASNLAQLGVEKVQLTLMHFPCRGTTKAADTSETWRAMEDFMRAGKSETIGVSNFEISDLTTLKGIPRPDHRPRVTPVVNQCKLSVVHHDDATIQYCKQQGIVYQSYSPLCGGFNGSSCSRKGGTNVLTQPEVLAAAAAHDVSPAQIGLKWIVQQNIPLTTAIWDLKYMRQDLDLWSWGPLSAEEMDNLTAVQGNIAKRAQCTSQLQQLCGHAKRANKGNCLICCGEHQSALQTAGCDQPEIDSFCG